MKLHHTLVEQLIKMYEIHAGFHDQKRLRDALASIDLTVYEQQNSGNEVLVSTDRLKELTGPRRG